MILVILLYLIITRPPIIASYIHFLDWKLQIFWTENKCSHIHDVFLLYIIIVPNWHLNTQILWWKFQTIEGNINIFKTTKGNGMWSSDVLVYTESRNLSFHHFISPTCLNQLEKNIAMREKCMVYDLDYFATHPQK